MSAPAELKTPAPLKSVHEALRAEIGAATKLAGRTGNAARLVARLIERHFAREEEFALPFLGLLPALAQGAIESPIPDAAVLAARLQNELADLLAEQRVIAAALEELMAVAENEGHADLVGFAERLMLHEEIERQVAYPAAVLISKCLQSRLKN